MFVVELPVKSFRSLVDLIVRSVRRDRFAPRLHIEDVDLDTATSPSIHSITSIDTGSLRIVPIGLFHWFTVEVMPHSALQLGQTAGTNRGTRRNRQEPWPPLTGGLQNPFPAAPLSICWVLPQTIKNRSRKCT